MDILELIKTRRSIRSFHKEKPVEDKSIKRLLEAAVWAPSGGNIQPWRFLVVKDASMRNQLSKAAFGQEYINEAPTSIVVCIDKAMARSKYRDRGLNLYSIQDTAAAIQNVLLCAHEMGLGSCWIGAFDEDKAAKSLKLDENLRPVAILPIGYPKTRPIPPNRKDLSEVVQWL